MSWTGGEPPHNEFLYHFAAAISGRYPDGKPLSPDARLPAASAVTAVQAFDYARRLDQHFTPDPRDTDGETPCIGQVGDVSALRPFGASP